MAPSIRDLRRNTGFFLAQIREQWAGISSPAGRVRAVRLQAALLQRQGLLALLVDLDPVEFSRGFSRAGQVWLALLQAARVSSVQVPASPCDVVLGTLGVGDVELARRIAEASATSRVAPEHEDEFRTADLFHRILRLWPEAPVDAPELAEACDLLEAAPGAMCPLRAALARAVLGREPERSWDLLVALHAAHERELEERSKSPGTRPDDLLLARALWIEGLAWIAIARARGLGEPPQLDGVPPWALAARAQPHGAVEFHVRPGDALK